MRRIFGVRRAEFAVAFLAAAAVVVVGIELGIVVAVVASIVDHLRHSYLPHSAVLRKSREGHWHATPVAAGERTVEGLAVYRFGSSLYFANAPRLLIDVGLLTGSGGPVVWFCLDAAAIGDIDYSAAAVLDQVRSQLSTSGTRVVLANVIDPVRHQLDGYGFTTRVGADAYFETAGAALEHFEHVARLRPDEQPSAPPTEPRDEPAETDRRRDDPRG